VRADAHLARRRKLDGGAAVNRRLEPPVRDPVVEAYKRDLDRTLLRENLKLTVDERFRQLAKLQKFADQLRKGGRRSRKKR